MPKIKDKAKRERNALLFFGCTESEAIALNGGAPLRQSGSKSMRYLYQRQSAFKRAVGWEITFSEWVALWVDSGKYHLRGVGIGRYCMARHGDSGPYRIGNVSIQTCTQNSRDGIEKARPAMNKCEKRKAGYGRGWTFRAGMKNPYQVVIGRKYIGCFPSQTEAESAYRDASKNHLIGVLS